MSPNPPKRPPPLPTQPAAEEIVAADAVHTYRPPASADQVPTAPPPADHRRPARGTLAGLGLRVPPLRAPSSPELLAANDEHTLVAFPPPPPSGPVSEPPQATVDDGDRPSKVDAIAASAKTVEIKAQLADKRVEVEALRLELEAVQLERKLAAKARKQPNEDTLKPLVLKLVAAFTGLIITLTATAQLLNQYVEWKLQDVKAKQQATDTVVKPAAATAVSADKTADAVRDWAKAYAEYDRQRFEKLGIIEPAPKGAAPTKAIECDQNVPLRGGPICKLLTPPPPLP